MPSALKLTNFFILHAHKPYRLLANFPSPSHAAAAVDSWNIPRLSSLSSWRCSTTILFHTPSRVSPAPKFSRGLNHGQNLCFYTSDSGKYGQFDRGRSGNLGTPMGAAVDGKVETAAREESDLPPPSEKSPRKSSKLLTLPTILTIGRVAAIPILVYSMC